MDPKSLKSDIYPKQAIRTGGIRGFLPRHVVSPAFIHRAKYSAASPARLVPTHPLFTSLKAPWSLQTVGSIPRSELSLSAEDHRNAWPWESDSPGPQSVQHGSRCLSRGQTSPGCQAQIRVADGRSRTQSSEAELNPCPLSQPCAKPSAGES